MRCSSIMDLLCFRCQVHQKKLLMNYCHTGRCSRKQPACSQMKFRWQIWPAKFSLIQVHEHVYGQLFSVHKINQNNDASTHKLRKFRVFLVVNTGRTHQGLAVLFSNQMFHCLEQVSNISDTVRFRVYEVNVLVYTYFPG